MNSLAMLAVSWEPELRGYVVVIIAAVVLIGGSYLVVGTNLGARLGFLVVLAGLFGWMAAMGVIWWTYEFGAGEFVSVSVFDRGGERWPKINETLDFFAFFHEPRFALVEVAPIVPQRVEPGRAPARPKIDETQERRYVYMVRDLGNRRQPAMMITLGSLLVFVILCWLLHRRDLILRQNLVRARELEKV